jgi:hypothetical protein
VAAKSRKAAVKMNRFIAAAPVSAAATGRRDLGSLMVREAGLFSLLVIKRFLIERVSVSRPGQALLPVPHV